MRIPVDFITYEVELSGSAKVLIYSGYNPTRMPAEGGSDIQKFIVPSGSYDYVLTPDGKHVITYTSGDNKSPILQIVIDKISPSQKGLFADFLNAFRPCKNDGSGAVCDKEQVLFKDVAQKVFKKTGVESKEIGSKR